MAKKKRRYAPPPIPQTEDARHQVNTAAAMNIIPRASTGSAPPGDSQAPKFQSIIKVLVWRFMRFS